MEVSAVVRVARASCLRPGMLVGHVIAHQVEDEADAPPAHVASHEAHVVDRAEVRTHRAVVGHRVATVAVAVAGTKQRHQVDR